MKCLFFAKAYLQTYMHSGLYTMAGLQVSCNMIPDNEWAMQVVIIESEVWVTVDVCISGKLKHQIK